MENEKEPLLTGLSQLYPRDYSLDKIFAMRQIWQPCKRFVMSDPRPTDALLLFSDAEAVCILPNGETRRFEKWALVHLPRGSQYTWQFGNAGKGETLLFEFIPYDSDRNAVTIAKEPNVYTVEEGLQAMPYEKEFRLLIEETRRPLPCLGYVRAAAYRLLSHAARDDYRKRYSCKVLSDELRVIEKGINYLEEDPVQTLSIREIAEMCHVSVNYFEKLFKLYSGVTPSAYRQERKLEKIRFLLESGSMTLSQIADEFDFCDVAYLCRVFQKKYGISPSKYRKMFR